MLLLGKGMHHLVIQTTPADLVFRFGLRPLVVALDPLRSGPLPTARRWLRAFPSCPRRAGAHLRQGWNRRLASTNGALAGRAKVVCRGALAPCGDHPCRDVAKRPARSQGSHFGRVEWLDGHLYLAADAAGGTENGDFHA